MSINLTLSFHFILSTTKPLADSIDSILISNENHCLFSYVYIEKNNNNNNNNSSSNDLYDSSCSCPSIKQVPSF